MCENLCIKKMVHFGIDEFGDFRLHGHTDSQHFQAGRCETGSYFSTRKNESMRKAINTNGSERGGDPWSYIIPYDYNASVNTILRFDKLDVPYDQNFKTPGDLKSMTCKSMIEGAPIGILFPISGKSEIRMGVSVLSMKVNGRRIRSTAKNIPVSGLMYTFRVQFFGESGNLIGQADVLPNVNLNNTRTVVTHDNYRASPAVNSTWINSLDGSSIVVTEKHAKACLDGEFAPWSPDIPSTIEIIAYKMHTE